MTDILRISPNEQAVDVKTGVLQSSMFRFLQFVANKAQFIGQGRTTSAVAGTASALPATPAGYQVVIVGGNEYVVPYYEKP
jgi:hypothetical protein